MAVLHLLPTSIDRKAAGRRPRTARIGCLFAGLALAAAAALAAPGCARGGEATANPSHPPERTEFTDAEIADGFFKIAFGAEMGLAGRVDRIRKYARPVRIFVENRAKPDRGGAVAAVVADIRKHIANLDLALTGDRAEANVILHLVRNRDLSRTVRALYGANGAQIVRTLDPQCLSGFRKDSHYRIERSDVILVADAGDFIFYDCAFEEILQALGPIRDDDTVPWTMFNDRVQKGYFDVYDQLLLNILYDRRIQAGMTREEVRALLPKVLPTVRAWVAEVNGLKR